MRSLEVTPHHPTSQLKGLKGVERAGEGWRGLGRTGAGWVGLFSETKC